MPIYEYKCDKCNCLWEEIQKFSDPTLTICKGCEQEGGVHKLIPGQMNFILKVMDGSKMDIHHHNNNKTMRVLMLGRRR